MIITHNNHLHLHYRDLFWKSIECFTEENIYIQAMTAKANQDREN